MISDLMLSFLRKYVEYEESDAPLVKNERGNYVAPNPPETDLFDFFSIVVEEILGNQFPFTPLTHNGSIECTIALHKVMMRISRDYRKCYKLKKKLFRKEVKRQLKEGKRK